jgi:hypothetical protein
MLIAAARPSHMTVMTATTTVEQALRQVQDNPNGSANAQAKAVLLKEVTRIWRNIQAEPGSYVMSNLEFAVFNCYRNNPDYHNTTGQQAVQRYWNHRRA